MAEHGHHEGMHQFIARQETEGREEAGGEGTRESDLIMTIATILNNFLKLGPTPVTNALASVGGKAISVATAGRIPGIESPAPIQVRIFLLL